LTHPHHDRAQAALNSLRTARRALHAAIAAEANALVLDPADSFRSPCYGSRFGSGGHSDPTASTLNAATARASRWEQLADRTTDTLRWLVDRLQAPGAGDPLGRLEAALPTMTVRQAEQLQLHLAEMDARIRIVLGLALEDYGTADEIAARLTTADRPITGVRIRDWARRSRTPGDRLHGLLPAIRTDGPRTGNAWYRLCDARRVAGLISGVDEQAA
jgi:hypothetical protein